MFATSGLKLEDVKAPASARWSAAVHSNTNAVDEYDFTPAEVIRPWVTATPALSVV